MHADVRIIAASNVNLQQQIAAKLFREDLYYRLNVLRLSVPALRARLEDVPTLANHFMALYSGISGRYGSRLTPSALQKLSSNPGTSHCKQRVGPSPGLLPLETSTSRG